MLLAATATVDKLDAPLLATPGDITVRAAQGLRIVDAAGNVATGTIRRDTSPGLLRIEGDQTIEANQHLALKLTGASQGDRLEVTGTLTLASGATLDVLRSQSYLPQLKDRVDLIKAGTLVGTFTEGTGLFGFGDGSRMLQLNQVGSTLSVEAVRRPLADLLTISAHSQADADRLGMFFNSDYFGTSRSYTVGMMLRAADFLTVTGSFVLRNDNATISLRDGSTADTRRWTVGGANLQAFVGLNGPQDLNHDGDFDDEVDGVKELSTAAAGFKLAGLDVALALNAEKLATGGRTAPRSWLSLKANADSATEVGIPFMTLDATALSVEVNATTQGENVVDLKTDRAMTVATGDGAQTIKLDFDSARGVQVKAAASFKLNISDFVTASGSLGFERSLRDVVLADGSKAKVQMLAFGGKGLNAFVGLNGPADGVYNAGTQPDAMGLSLGNVDFALALFSPQAGQTATQGLKWASVKATAGSVAVVGLPASMTVAASNLSLDLNVVDTSGATGTVIADNKVIDFAGGNGTRKIDVITGTGTTKALDLDGRLGEYLRATGDVDLGVGDFFKLRGSLGFERRLQEVKLADGSTVKTQMMSIGGTGLDAFVGFGPYQIQQNGQTIVNPDARGIKVSGVEFGVGLFSAAADQAGYGGKRWTALTANIGAIDALVGLPPDIDLNVHTLGVDISLASGFASNAGLYVIDFAKAPVQIATGTGKSLRLTHDGQLGELVRAAGGMDLKLGGFRAGQRHAGHPGRLGCRVQAGQCHDASGQGAVDRRHGPEHLRRHQRTVSQRHQRRWRDRPA
jgi:hypothetical protein